MAADDTAWCCISTAGHYPRMQVLLESIKRHLPGAPCTIFRIAAPRPRGALASLAECIDLTPALSCVPGTAGAPTWGEVAMACKPLALASMLDRGHRRVIFADTDLWVISPPRALLEALDLHDIVLTPHAVLPPGRHHTIERDLVLLNAGVFNAGIVGVRAGSNAEAFCRWWAERTLQFRDRPLARFSDQRWLSLVPYVFQGVGSVLDPGVNVGHWRIEHADDVVGTPEGLQVRGHPISILHMSGFDPEHPELLSQYVPSLVLPQESVLHAATQRYATLLSAAGRRRP